MKDVGRKKRIQILIVLIETSFTKKENKCSATKKRWIQYQ